MEISLASPLITNLSPRWSAVTRWNCVGRVCVVYVGVRGTTDAYSNVYVLCGCAGKIDVFMNVL